MPSKIPMYQGRVDYDRVRWEIQKCQNEGCYNDAELVWQDLALFCIECADILLERIFIHEQGLGEALSKLTLPEVGYWYERIREPIWTGSNESPILRRKGETDP